MKKLLILEESSKKLEDTQNTFLIQSRSILVKIRQFPNTKIPFEKEGVSKEIQPIMMEFNFKWSILDSVLSTFIGEYFRLLEQWQEYPPILVEFYSLFKDILSKFFKKHLTRIKVARPEANDFSIYDLETTLKESGGEGATFAIVLYCLIAYYKAYFVRSENAQIGNININLPFINDNPTGKVNRFDMVQMQLEIARKLNIQMIFFSPIADERIIQEFD